MGGIKKFKTFEDADKYQLEEYCKEKFDPDKVERFFLELEGWSEIPYKPGLYKFKSFEDARDYDINKYVNSAIERRNK